MKPIISSFQGLEPGLPVLCILKSEFGKSYHQIKMRLLFTSGQPEQHERVVSFLRVMVLGIAIKNRVRRRTIILS